MTQAVGHRGFQPPYQVSSAARLKSGQAQGTAAPTSTAQAVKFGGGFKQSLLNGSVGTFQNITEVFLWGFLAQDMVAMWMPRVWTTLQEGKVPYDPNQDPSTKNKPFREQLGAWVSGNWKGLNWVNFYEGTKREIATGPGLLAVPAVAYMLNRATLNPAVELSADSIHHLGEGLKDRFKMREKPFANKSELIKAVKENLCKGFADIEDVATKGLKVEGAGSDTLQKAQKEAERIQGMIKDWVNAEVAQSVEFSEKGGFERVYNGLKGIFSPAKEKPQATKLGEKLAIKLWDFNRDYRMNDYTQVDTLIQDAAPLNNRGKTWFSYHPDNLGKGIKQANFDQIKNDVSRVGGYLNKLWANMEKEGQANLVHATDKTMKQLIRTKWFMGAGVTTLTAAYLVKLAFWAQNHGTYQATRLLKEEAAQKRQDEKRSGTQQAATVPFQAGLPFGAEPAFSRWGQSALAAPMAPFNGNPGQLFNSPFANLSYPVRFQGQRAEGGRA